MRLALFCLLISSLMLAGTACKKGDTGDRGPQGPQGSQGPQGPTGTANVVYSDWLSVTASEWKDTTMTNVGQTKRIYKTASALTQQILDSGVVLVYLRDAFNTTYQLPFTYNISPGRVHAYIPYVGRFLFYEYALDGSGGVASTTNRYRYILIPGGVKTSGRAMSWRNMSYNEVCKVLNIPE